MPGRQGGIISFREALTVPNLRRASVALFLLAMGVLLLEVALTRVFSVMTWHHFAYLIISLALLGFGAASTFLTVSPRFAGAGIDEGVIGRHALAFCLTSVFGFAAATKVRFYWMDVFQYGDLSNVFSLLLLYVIVGVPFFYAGVCIGYLISRAGDAVNRLYFADLLGAGTGALLSIVCINQLGAEATIYAAGAAGAVVAVSYGRAGGRLFRFGSLAGLALCILMTVGAARGQIFPVYFPPDKMISSRAMEPHYHRWHVVARVDVMNPSGRLSDFGGKLSPRCPDPLRQVPIRAVYQDGAAPTGIVNVPQGDVSKVPALGQYLQGAPYVAKPAAERALIIGVGGGVDVLIALHHGARHVVGVEMNPVIVEAVRHRYADFAGRIFDRPDVEIVTAEGRHYLTTTEGRFDVIQLSGVDTFTASAAGAYALSENYLYTVEAMRDYWDHLREDGVLSFSRCLFAPPRETLRLVAIQLDALDRIGIEDARRHLIVISGTSWGTSWAETLLKKSEFTSTEVTAYRQWAARLGFDVRYDPYRSQDNAFDRLIRSPPSERAAMIERYPYRIRPISDDDPFFFQFAHWRSIFNPPKQVGDDWGFPVGLVVLLLTLVQILILAALLIIGPLLSRVEQLRRVRHKGRLLVYFGALGLGFITVEIALLQKYAVFVGGPVYAMAVTLFAVLVFSGIGSLLARRLAQAIPHALTVILLALVGAIVAEAMFVNHAVPRLMSLSHSLRCGVTVLAVAPLAVLMGMPFPTGLRVAQRLGFAIVPWAWGVNAVTTTLGSMLCVLVSMEWGFTASLFAAAAVYLLSVMVGLDGLSGDGQAENG